MIPDQKTKLFINEMLGLKKPNIENDQTYADRTLIERGQQNNSPIELLRSMNIVVGVDIYFHSSNLVKIRINLTA